MRFNLSLICHQLVKAMFFTGLISLLIITPALAATVKAQAGTPLEDKLYRKALYFYFTGHYGEALNQINLNRQRFNSTSPRSRLFEAGLQVTVGLHHQAAESLQQLQRTQEASRQSTTENINQASKQGTAPEELKLIALLQLAEQQIQQGENKAAQQTLSHIKEVLPIYSQQYQMLNQLAYWPELPVQSAVNVSAKNVEGAQKQHPQSDPYIQLNIALLHLEHNEFEQAEPLLNKIKNTLWSPPTKTFWQLLFNPLSDENDSDYSVEISEEKIQQRAVNDYAQLLLAQMYVKQERYDAAYYELENFPQDSPYTESALFIFAFSAQQIKQYTRSRKLLNLMKDRYPYSNLAWQSALLLSSHVVEQLSLEEGMTSYQNAERLYQKRLKELAGFHNAFLNNDDLLNFSSPPAKQLVLESKTKAETEIVESSQSFIVNRIFTTDSVWLQKALIDKKLQASFQALLEIDLITNHLQAQQEKNQWLQGTLRLNNKRKTKVLEIQQQKDFQATITELIKKKQSIANVIAETEKSQLGKNFANQAQEKWLERINASKQAIVLIADNKDIDEYQERVKRVEGVLHWQLQQAFPEQLWRHKKQLKEIDQLIKEAQQQSSRFALHANSPSLLSNVGKRVRNNAANIKILLANVTKLRAKKTKEIHEYVQQFVAKQQAILAQHLLTSQHEMAAVLESMAKQDKRIERQLSPSTPKRKVKEIDRTANDNSKFTAASLLEYKHRETL